MSKLVVAVVGLVVGYIAGVLVGAGLIQVLSSNTHDKSVEMAMTAAFVTGPIGALVGCVWGLLRRKV